MKGGGLGRSAVWVRGRSPSKGLSLLGRRRVLVQLVVKSMVLRWIVCKVKVFSRNVKLRRARRLG